jgi:hypothetical protein
VPITITCTCGKSLQVADEHAGKQGKCPVCGHSVSIPDANGGDFTEQAPPMSPSRKSAESWSNPRTDTEAPPEPDDEIGQLTTHAGVLINEDDDFFASAPNEIGRLYSAFTTLRTDVDPRPLPFRLVLVAIFSLVTFILGALFSFFVSGAPLEFTTVLCIMAIWAAVGALEGGMVLWWTRFRHTCSYVGVKGIAAYSCSGDRENVRQTELFLFRDAAELRIGQTRHYYNGVYTGTNYSFTWSDERGTIVHKLGGRYSSEAGTPVVTDPYHYALMTETAWTMYLFRDIDRIMTGDELLFFGLNGNDYVQLGSGLLILVQGGKTIELHSHEIEKMNVGNGVISVWEIGAKEGWFVNSGIHQFMYHDLGNARFFMFAVKKLLGIRF